MTEVLARVVPASLANPETQAFILAGLCLVGSWVLITKIIQLVFSMLWPVLLIGACLTFAPNWAGAFISKLIPEYIKILQENYKKIKERIASMLNKT